MVPTAAVVAALLVLVHPPLSAAAAASQFSIAPAEGPPGTTITLTGKVPASQRDSILKNHTLTLEQSANGGIFQLIDNGDVTIDAVGHLVGTFQVPTRGDYNHGRPDSFFHPTMTGTYELYFPCHACALGQTFVITGPTSELATTGTSDATLALLAGTLLLTGAVSVQLGRQRKDRSA